MPCSLYGANTEWLLAEIVLTDWDEKKDMEWCFQRDYTWGSVWRITDDDSADIHWFLKASVELWLRKTAHSSKNKTIIMHKNTPSIRQRKLINSWIKKEKNVRTKRKMLEHSNEKGLYWANVNFGMLLWILCSLFL